MKEDFMKGRCCDFVLHLMDHPEDLNLVHSVLQAKFITEGWLDAPVPLSAGGPFDPLLVAVRAAQSSKDSEPQPSTVKLHEPQHAAKPLDSQLQELQPATKVQELQPATKLQELQPAAKLQELQPAAKLQELQPAAKLQELQPAAKLQELQS
ncbi:hypothetical protein XENOCAPTIV_017946, partial [Xenoophorus captivus]